MRYRRRGYGRRRRRRRRRGSMRNRLFRNRVGRRM